jgi:dimethylargininase
MRSDCDAYNPSMESAGTLIALVRSPSDALLRCELTHLERQVIDANLARAQHAGYAAMLERLGAKVIRLADLPDHPDGVFVEDTAVVVAEAAVITRPGALVRRGEIESTAAGLAPFRPLHRLIAPAQLDGGDVLRAGQILYVGLSARSNEIGCRALERVLAPFGYAVRGVAVSGCLHLKSAATFIPPRWMFVNPAWVDVKCFQGFEIIEVDADEPFAANTLTIGGKTIVSAAFPKSIARLRQHGIDTLAIDVSELQKAEAGTTCMSVIFSA